MTHFDAKYSFKNGPTSSIVSRHNFFFQFFFMYLYGYNPEIDIGCFIIVLFLRKCAFYPRKFQTKLVQLKISYQKCFVTFQAKTNNGGFKEVQTM